MEDLGVDGIILLKQILMEGRIYLAQSSAKLRDFLDIVLKL